MEDIGYHYLLHHDGVLESGRYESAVGAHAFGRNSDSIGICLMGDFSKYPPTDMQIEAARVLYKRLCARYETPLLIEFHRAWPNPCPGVKLNRKEFAAFIANGFRP